MKLDLAKIVAIAADRADVRSKWIGTRNIASGEVSNNDPPLRLLPARTLLEFESRLAVAGALRMLVN